MSHENSQSFLAFDLGAESGRAMLATLEGERLTLDEVHRFPNGILQLPDGLHWNFTTLWANLLEGLRRGADVARRRKTPLLSLGVDTWGVDFGLLGSGGQLLHVPIAYRDPRHAKSYDDALAKVGGDAIYDATGIQLMSINSLFQLLTIQREEPGLLPLTKQLLFVPDLLHYFFCGKKVTEASIASTSSFADPRTRGWATELLRKLGLPTNILPPIVQPGTVLGEILPYVAEETGADRGLKVVTPAAHDTASAIAAVPYDAEAGKKWAYISSGTWSLMGAELKQPVLTQAAKQANFTHEWGVDGTIRFLKNIAGLWLVQECRRQFAREGHDIDYGTLTDMARQAPSMHTLVNPAHPPLLIPGDLPGKIAAYARATGQPVPENPAQFVRCCLESLAMAYRHVLEDLESVLGYRVDVLHVVGGGGKNTFLNQLTADAIHRPVIVGPYEGTAIGNALVQALGIGAVRDLAHLRSIVRESFPIETYQPQADSLFDEHYPRYRKLVATRVAS